MNNQLEIKHIIQWMEKIVDIRYAYIIGGMDNNNAIGIVIVVKDDVVIVRNGRDRSLRRQYQQQR